MDLATYGGPRGLGGSYVESMNRIGNGPRIVKALPKNIPAHGGGILAHRPIQDNAPIRPQVQQYNQRAMGTVDPQFMRNKQNEALMQQGAGVRPGNMPAMNPVQAARMAMGGGAQGIGGSMVPPGGGVSPRQAALAPYMQGR